MKKLIQAISCLFFVYQAMGQPQPVCGFDGLHTALSKSSPSYTNNMKSAELELQRYLKANPTTPQPQGVGTAIFTIPVVVHIVHTGQAIGSIYNPGDATILSVLDYLNQCFDGTAPGFSGGAGDIQIQFVPAKRDPNCNGSNGIDRVDGSVSPGYTVNGVNRSNTNGVSDLTLKNQSRWDPSRYYNIWVVNKIDGKDGTSGQFVAGYAFFAEVNAQLDGTVMLATQMFAGSKILPHEIGHALNLYHPFQGSANNTICPPTFNCSETGDLVCDTDPINNNTTVAGVTDFSCRTGINSCTGTPFNANTESNVMSYTNCFRLFTPGQKQRMLAAMSLPSRVSLANSTALFDTYSGTVQCPPKINFGQPSLSVSETTAATSTCMGYKDYTLSLTITNAPSIETTVVLNGSGTATEGADYLIFSNGDFNTPSKKVTFPAGIYNNQSFTIRIFDDAAIESTEDLVLTFTIDNGGGNALRGEAISICTITIQNNDVAPVGQVQTPVFIGQSNVNLGSPFMGNQLNGRTQMLYTADELLGAGLTKGTIEQLTFDVSQKNSFLPYYGFSIRMKNVGYYVLPAAAEEGGTVVFGPVDYNTVFGLNVFNLFTPFVWDGVSNVLVDICFSNQSYSNFDLVRGTSGISGMTRLAFNAQVAGCNIGDLNLTYSGGGARQVIGFAQGMNGPQVETSVESSSYANLGPFDEVYFYNASNGNILAKIKNLSAFDYGCTRVLIDRAGTGAKLFNNPNANQAVADKTIHVVPTNNNAGGSYEITLYYKQAEVAGLKAVTGMDWTESRILKVPQSVSSYVPGQVPQNIIQAPLAEFSNYGSDHTITTTFSSGFSGFAVGYTLVAPPQTYVFTGTGNWSVPANWNKGLMPPANLPAGSKIIINHLPEGNCTLNIPQTIQPGGSLTVRPNMQFRILGNLTIKL